MYVMGHGRTGSTALAMLLGSAPGAESVGEVSHFFRDARKPGATCTCGNAPRDCPVWRGPFQELLSSPDWQPCITLSRRVETHWTFPLTFLGWPTAKSRDSYRWLLAATLASLAHASPDASTLIDSSKYAGRAVCLLQSLPNVSVLWMIRSPRGIVTSFRRRNVEEQPRKSLLNLLLYYTWVAICCRCVELRWPSRVTRVRFENLRRDPVTSLDRLEASLGLDLSAVAARVGTDLPLEKGHVVTGNRMRHAATIRFRPEEDQPLEAFNLGERILIRLITMINHVLRI